MDDNPGDLIQVSEGRWQIESCFRIMKTDFSARLVYVCREVWAVTNSGIKYDEGEEAVDVCQAIQEMRKEPEQKKAQEVAGNLYKMGLDIEKIVQAVGYAVEMVKDFDFYTELFHKNVQLFKAR